MIRLWHSAPVARGELRELIVGVNVYDRPLAKWLVQPDPHWAVRVIARGVDSFVISLVVADQNPYVDLVVTIVDDHLADSFIPA
jgi:hypothetical protein